MLNPVPGGGEQPEQTMTGVPPLTFISTTDILISYSIDGNLVQSGTPTPGAPIYPQECGDKTENIFDVVAFSENAFESKATIARNGNTIILTATANDAYINQVFLEGSTPQEQYRPSCISVDPETEYTIHLSKAPKCYISWLNDSFLAVANYTRIPASYEPTAYTFTTPVGCTKILLRIGEETTTGNTFQFSDIMIVKGSTTPSSYIPFGYRITPTVNNTQYPIYLSEPLRKIGSYADTVNSDGTVTRWIKKLVLAGTEEWTAGTGGNVNRKFLSNITDYLKNEGNISICSHYPTNASISSIFQAQYGVSFYYPAGGTYRLYIRDDQTLEDFTQWLADEYSAGHPVCVWYALATPTTETITAPTIQTIKGLNTFNVDTTLPPSNVSITYK